jgi:hypothetical protein
MSAAMPTSLAISASLNPEANAPVRICCGILRSVVLFFPVEALMTPIRVCGSMPKALETSSASKPASVPAAPR